MADEYIITQEDLDQGNSYLQTLTTEHPVCRIVDGVTEIESHAFEDCRNLTSIILPESLTSIGEYAFHWCSNITNIIIPNGVTTIEGDTFSGCSRLVNITLPENLTSINYEAFYNCYNITEIVIPKGVTYIGSHAFESCSGLTSITIPDSVTTLQDYVFLSCSGLTNITLPDGLTAINYGAFSGCSNLISIEIPNSVTSIGENAFNGCSSLTSITIPNGVTSISNSTFYRCTALTSITIPENVTSIGEYAFYECSSLTSITIPDSVTSVGYSAFDHCSSLQTVNVSPNFDQTILENVDIPSSAQIVVVEPEPEPEYIITQEDLNKGNSYLQTLTTEHPVCRIADGVTEIGSSFESCRKLTSIIIPNSITSLSNNAFVDCRGLTSITIPDSVTSIGDAAFEFCKSLTSITIPNSVESIGDAAFDTCTNLTSIIIPDSVTSIGEGVFNCCDNLKTIKISPNFDQTLLEGKIPSSAQIVVVEPEPEPDPEYNQEDERLLVKGNERITRDLKVQGNIFGDSNHKAFLPNIKSNSIELGNGVVRKIAKNAQSGVVSFDATNEKFVTSDDLTLPGDLVVDGQITARKDLSVSGDLYVNGTEHINDVETIQSSDDYFVLRHNKSTALGANEHAGIAVHNYALDKTATLTTDNQGIWRVADNSETSTVYTGVSYYNGDYFTGLTQTATTVIDGIKTAYDQDELDECALYNGSFYYHFDGINWYGVSLVDNVLTVGEKVEDADVITALEALTRNDLVYYRSLTVTVINEVQNQPLLTRAEESALDNGDILAWDATTKKAVNLTRPVLNNTYLKALIDSQTGVVTYTWASGGGNGVAFIGTRAQYNTARLIPQGQDGFIPAHSKVIITDEDAYVTGEEI